MPPKEKELSAPLTSLTKKQSIVKGVSLLSMMTEKKTCILLAFADGNGAILGDMSPDLMRFALEMKGSAVEYSEHPELMTTKTGRKYHKVYDCMF